MLSQPNLQPVTKSEERIRQGVLRLVSEQGFREYYDPITGTGLGGKNFSWTAALVIDIIMMKRHLFPKSIAPLALGSGKAESTIAVDTRKYIIQVT